MMLIALFLMGFMLAICLLAYSSMQVAEIGRKVESLESILKERYSKSIKDLSLENKEAPKEEEQPAEAENAEG